MSELHEAYVEDRYIRCTDGRSVLNACDPDDFMEELAERWTLADKYS